MKSIEEYVNLEPKYYQYVLDNYQTLFVNKLNNIETSSIDSVVIYATGSSSNAAYGALPFMSKVLEMPVQVEEPSISENYLLNVKKTLYALQFLKEGTAIQ